MFSDIDLLARRVGCKQTLLCPHSGTVFLPAPHGLWRQGVYLTVLLYLLLGLHLYLPAMGGSGLQLPMNMMTWLFVALCVLVFAVLYRPQGRAHPSPMFRYLCVGAGLMLVPLAWTPFPYLADGTGRFIGLAGGLVFYWVLSHTRLLPRQQALLLYALLAAGVIESLIGLLQLAVLPYGTPYALIPGTGWRPYGIFQQPNLMASFIATALAVTLLLLLDRRFETGQSRTEGRRQVGLLITVGLFALLLTLLQSRVGLLGAGMVLMLFSLHFYRSQRPRVLRVWGCILLGIAVADGLSLWLTQPLDLAHTGSTQQRLMILGQTLRMITLHPWAGWGYGSFEYAFQHFLAARQHPLAGAERVQHPHNDILYWCMEGGAVALIGVGILLVGYGRVFLRAWRQRTRPNRRGDWALGWGILTLPIFLHTQVEFPFTLSAPHWVIFLLLLCLFEKQTEPVSRVRATTPQWVVWPLLSTAIIGSLLAMVFLVTALQTGALLSQAERQGLRTVPPITQLWNPWVFADRLAFDRQVNRLLFYNQTHDARILQDYLTWSAAFLQHHVDKHVYDNRIRILRFTGQAAEAERLRQEALRIYQGEPLFDTPVQPGPVAVRGQVR